MNKTGIEWCDYTWNPIAGCSPISEGCDHCYAEAISRRFHLPWGRPVFIPGRLDQPARVKKPGRVFVCSMSDIGHASVKPQWRVRINEAMLAAPWHTYIILTKRPGPWMQSLPSSCWLGVTVENQRQAENRIPDLIKTNPAVRFVSVEPILDRVTLTSVNFPTGVCENVLDTAVNELAKPTIGKLNGLDWVIAGPETGPRARPCNDRWMQHLEVECVRAGIPFFDKRNVPNVRREWPKGDQK